MQGPNNRNLIGFCCVLGKLCLVGGRVLKVKSFNLIIYTVYDDNCAGSYSKDGILPIV